MNPGKVFLSGGRQRLYRASKLIFFPQSPILHMTSFNPCSRLRRDFPMGVAQHPGSSFRPVLPSLTCILTSPTFVFVENPHSFLGTRDSYPFPQGIPLVLPLVFFWDLPINSTFVNTCPFPPVEDFFHVSTS